MGDLCARRAPAQSEALTLFSCANALTGRSTADIAAACGQGPLNWAQKEVNAMPNQDPPQPLVKVITS